MRKWALRLELRTPRLWELWSHACVLCLLSCWFTFKYTDISFVKNQGFCLSLYIREKFYIGLNCAQSCFFCSPTYCSLSFLTILIIIIYYYILKKRNKRNKNKEKRVGKNRSDQRDKILVLLRTKFLYIDRGESLACDVLIHLLFCLHP